MNMKLFGSFIRSSRERMSLSRQELAGRLEIPEEIVSRWEDGLSCPDLGDIKALALVLDCRVADFVNASVSMTDGTECESGEDVPHEDVPHEDVGVTFEKDSARAISPLLFGDNLEHTRGCINGGLSAEILRNRKFVGKPGRYGCAHDWYPIGEKPFFFFGSSAEYMARDLAYTRHAEGYRMHRRHERNAQYITSYQKAPVGFGQKDLYLRGGMDYRFEIALRATVELPITVTLLGGDRSVYDTQPLTALPGEYVEQSVILHAPKEDWEARLEITFDGEGTLAVGAVSMMPCDHFHGMRRDVIDCMKAEGIRLLRWPGGNFAGEYNWKDGLLPRNMRAPLQSYQWLETQPHTHGYDYHDINTDDFVALCREIGAEPFITLNPTWNTPEESAQWVEYCNGDESTPYGRLRAERGHKEPYNVQFWSLGNEAGYGHMEGANTADAYARVVREHAVKMLEVSPNLTLCSSGPYPNRDWVEYSVKALADMVPFVSLHQYTQFPAYMDPAAKEREYTGFIHAATAQNLDCTRSLREMLGDSPVKISFDEWNAWYAWYRPGSVSEGIFVAAFLNMLYRNADRYGVGMGCHFESVNEGAIMVHPNRAELAPAGQVFSLMKEHAGGQICALRQDVVATRKEGVLTCTLINRSYGMDKTFRLDEVSHIDSATVYASEDVVPGSAFTAIPLPYVLRDGGAEVVLPPHSIAQLRIQWN